MKWQPMETAPKDGTLIVGLCRHDADPYFDGDRLTPYGANVEGWSHVGDGPHVVCWGKDYTEGDHESGYYTIPAWWHRYDSYGEEAANPVAWIPLPEALESE